MDCSMNARWLSEGMTTETSGGVVMRQPWLREIKPQVVYQTARRALHGLDPRAQLTSHPAYVIGFEMAQVDRNAARLVVFRGRGFESALDGAALDIIVAGELEGALQCLVSGLGCKQVAIADREQGIIICYLIAERVPQEIPGRSWRRKSRNRGPDRLGYQNFFHSF